MKVTSWHMRRKHWRKFRKRARQAMPGATQHEIASAVIERGMNAIEAEAEAASANRIGFKP